MTKKNGIKRIKSNNVISYSFLNLFLFKWILFLLLLYCSSNSPVFALKKNKKFSKRIFTLKDLDVNEENLNPKDVEINYIPQLLNLVFEIILIFGQNISHRQIYYDFYKQSIMAENLKFAILEKKLNFLLNKLFPLVNPIFLSILLIILISQLLEYQKLLSIKQDRENPKDKSSLISEA